MISSRGKNWRTAACITLFIGLFIGCAKPTDGPTGDDPASGKKTWTVKFAGLPDDCASGKVYLKAYDSDGLTDSIDLGTMTPSSGLEKSIALDPDAVELDVLIDGNTSYDYQYFTVIDLTKASGTELSNYYWVDYYCFTQRSDICYGLNSADVVITQTGKSIVSDFTDAPFYVCKIENVKGRNIQLVDDGGTENVLFYEASDITKLCSLGRLASMNYSSINECTVSDGALYILCAPGDYSKAAKVNVRIVDQTDSVPAMKAHCFIPEDAASIDGKTVYLYSKDSKTLKKWVLATDTITDSYQFNDKINRIVTDGSRILVAAGSALYEYNPQTDTPEKKYTSDGTIRNFCLLGSDRIVVFEAPSLYSGTLGLLDKSYVKYSTTPVNDIPFGEMLAVIGSDTTPARVYFGNDYHSLYYLNVSSDKLSDAKYVQTTYKIGGVKNLDTNFIVTKNGEVFTVENETLVYKSLLETSLDDILPLADKNLALVSAEDSATSIQFCFLMTYGLKNPYEKLKRSGFVKNEIGIKLLKTPEGVLMVSRQYLGTTIFGFYYCPVHITKVGDVDTVVTQSFSLAGAKPAALNGKKPYSTLGLGAVVDANR